MNTFMSKEVDRLEICRGLDKVQVRRKKNLLTQSHVENALRYLDLFKEYGQKIYVTVYSGFSYKGYEYKSRGTILTVTEKSFFVRWDDLPVQEPGKVSLYYITVEKPFYEKKQALFMTATRSNFKVHDDQINLYLWK